MYKENLALNNLQWLICHKTKQNQTKHHKGISLWCNGYGTGLRNCSKQVQTPAVLLCSLSDKDPWGRYEPPPLSNYGLNSITTTVLLEGWLCH